VWIRIFIAVLLLGSMNNGFCNEYKLVTLSTVKARPLAMGGAFVSMEDNLASLDFNPAAFTLSSSAKRAQFSFFLNPLGPLLIKENRGKISDWDVLLGFIIHGAAVSLGGIQFGVLWGEEALMDMKRLGRTCLFDGTGYRGQRNTSFGLSLHLAPRVSLGLAGEVLLRKENDNIKGKLGYRYGILLKPRNDLNVGLCFFDFPKAYKEDRKVLERLADETLNIGVSYTPWRFLTLALDIRNVSDEGKGVVREPHIGFETSPLRCLRLRGGYYRGKGGGDETISFGIGFLTGRSNLSEDRFFFHPTFELNTTLLWQKDRDEKNRWLFLSCVVRI
jgi:hypothetical protein